jgi:hypothetical protein
MHPGLRPTLCLRCGSVLTTSTTATPTPKRMICRRIFSMYTGSSLISCITMALEIFCFLLYPVGQATILHPKYDNEPYLAFNRSPLVLSYNTTAQAQEAAGITAWNNRLRAAASEFQAERHGTIVTVIDTSVHNNPSRGNLLTNLGHRSHSTQHLIILRHTEPRLLLVTTLTV